MPTYYYNSKSLSGEPHKGVLEAKGEHELARILRLQGYILISTRLEGEVKAKRKISIPLPFLNRVSLAEKVFFTRNLRVMIVAGISLPRALGILAGQAKSKAFKNALLDIADEITKGKNFAESITKYPNIFPELFASMVKVGEEGGTLEEVLRVLTHQMERESELKSKIKGAMVYPAVILFAMVVIGILMMVLVVPKLAQTFSDLNVELPLTTRLLIGAANLASKFWYLIPVIFVGLFVLIRMAMRTKMGKSFIDILFLKLPLISPLVKKTNAAFTVRSLSSLINAGVPIVRSLEIVAGTLSNDHYKKAILDTAEKVRKGAKIAESLKKYENLYPSLVIQMIEIGEETGETANILQKLADFFEEEVSNATKNLSSIVEPVLMLIIGAAVGFFAISMFQPIYSMLGEIK